MVLDENEIFYSWLTIELGNDFHIEHTACPALAHLLTFERHYYAFIIQESKLDNTLLEFLDLPTTAFILTDNYNSLQMHHAKGRGFSGYFVKHDPSRLLLRALLNPSLRNFWVSDKTETSFRVPPNFNKYLELTGREKEVFTLLADGMSYKEVGFKLGISGKTVLSHRERLMRKMGMETNTSLIKEAIKLGLLSL